jgi:hypothetical protein
LVVVEVLEQQPLLNLLLEELVELEVLEVIELQDMDRVL